MWLPRPQTRKTENLWMCQKLRPEKVTLRVSRKLRTRKIWQLFSERAYRWLFQGVLFTVRRYNVIAHCRNVRGLKRKPLNFFGLSTGTQPGWNPYKLSILSDIWRALILPFSSCKYFYSCSRPSNLVDLSFEYLSFQTNGKQSHFFPVLSRFCNGL